MKGSTMTKMFDVRNSDAFRRLREVERVAQSIFLNQPLFVPGVLQEPAYAQEALRGVSGLAADDPELAERVAERNERHAALLARLDGDGAPEVHVVIDEAVLRRSPVGSAAMRTQIEHLIEVSRRPTVHIGIVPLDHGPHPGLAGTFEVHDALGGSIVFFEGGQGDAVLDDDPDRIAGYRNLVRSLMDSAASGEDARKLMSGLLNG